MLHQAESLIWPGFIRIHSESHILPSSLLNDAKLKAMITNEACDLYLGTAIWKIMKTNNVKISIVFICFRVSTKYLKY